MSEELKLEACPCCGGQISVHGQQTLNLWKLCRAHCASCGLTTANYATPEEAAAAMNRRAPSAPAPEFAALVEAAPKHLAAMEDLMRTSTDSPLYHGVEADFMATLGVFKDCLAAAERALKDTK